MYRIARENIGCLVIFEPQINVLKIICGLSEILTYLDALYFYVLNLATPHVSKLHCLLAV